VTERKPLDLKVYPIWDSGFGDLYADKDDPQHPTRVDFEVYRKRLTDHELAAEYWMQYADLHYFTKDGKPQTRGKHERRSTMGRFATLPHYDEEES
jgi:hypothetical protein